MTNQRVVSHQFPYVPARIQFRDHNLSDSALIDTGFTGSVCVPGRLLDNIAAESPDAHTYLTLADDNRISVPLYLGVLNLSDTFYYLCTILVVGDEVMIGREITDDLKVTLDHGTRVILDP